MAADDLNRPLKGTRTGRAPGGGRGGGTVRAVNLAVGALVAAGLALTAWLVLRSDPFGGEPVAVVALGKGAPQSAGLLGEDGTMRASIGPGDETGPAARPVDEDDSFLHGRDRSDGEVVRITIHGVRPGNDGDGDTAEDAPAGPQPRPGRAAGPLASVPDPGLVERAKIGLLPRIGHDGRRPWQVYARRADDPPAGDAPVARIAIMIGALGISAQGTDLAIKRLPAPVSLAFAPYGRDLQAWVNKARQNGHEVLLQLPMEPFDYPDNDPGPHTMLTGSTSAENLERLHWLLARMTGYFAVTNYMGAKFTATTDALAPVLDEIARRGLAYVEDGASPRSVAGTVAHALDLPAGTGDVVIDAGQTRESIAAALDRLEAMARRRGFALGVGSGLPATVEAIAEWAGGDLDRRGIQLVPVSALIARPPHS